MTVQYDGKCMYQRKVYEWVERLKGKLTCSHNRRSERSSTVTSVEVKSRSINVCSTKQRTSINEIPSKI